MALHQRADKKPTKFQIFEFRCVFAAAFVCAMAFSLSIAEAASSNDIEAHPALKTPNAPNALDEAGANSFGLKGALNQDRDSLEPMVTQEGVEIFQSLDPLPDAVRKTRQNIIKAINTGQVSALRPIFESTQDGFNHSFGDDGDPIAYWREMSGDGEGREVLAIMREIFEAGYAVHDRGTEDEIYIWPYFAALPLEGLTPRQIVDLFTIITAGEYDDMKQFGSYIFFRSGIDRAGNWVFFVSGD